MTETYDKINHWYGWNGGACPVSATAVVEVMGDEGKESGPAESFVWSMTDFIIAFRIISLAHQTIKREVALYRHSDTGSVDALDVGYAWRLNSVSVARISEPVEIEFTLLPGESAE